MMDNPLPMLDSNVTGSGSWRFDVDENVTRAPEILRATHMVAINSSTPETLVTGFLYFTQRVYQNGSLPGTTLMREDLKVWDCGTSFDCDNLQPMNDSDTVLSVYVEPWDASSFVLLPGLVEFRVVLPDDLPRRLKVVVPPYSFMGADSRPGSGRRAESLQRGHRMMVPNAASKLLASCSRFHRQLGGAPCPVRTGNRHRRGSHCRYREAGAGQCEALMRGRLPCHLLAF
ncbi:unnamed protein product [Symbiodinium necroappetens]|uniref:Uncharacterized protein n=1 Tax=Symbiodinium necroappetens TaxID=1628268 RepID=A0A812YFF8_9DINO|nr:unnamed protein product [Symbiodinium necroappetens]